MMQVTPEQQDRYRRRLEALEAELIAQNEVAGDAAGVVELDQSRVGRLSRMDALQSQAMSVETSRRRALLLRRVRSALARIEAGEYGDCLECGGPIPAGRLEIDPATPTCVGCAEAAER
jgi:DnaK suppressor protein